jgi:hypothetical protein
MRVHFVISIGILSFAAANLGAAERGKLTMRFVYDGEPPQPSALNTGGGGARPVVDESLLVNKRDRGIQNVCVWLLSASGDSPPIHPSYQQSARDKLTMTIAGGNFAPRIMAMRTTQSLVFRNAELYAYNLKGDFQGNQSFNHLLEAGASIEKTWKVAETTPMPITCSIHPWLMGYVLVRDDPYAATSDEHGRLTIADLPAGKQTFVVWHERYGFVRNASRAGNPVNWPRGRVTLEIKPGDNDLREIKLSTDYR